MRATAGARALAPEAYDEAWDCYEATVESFELCGLCGQDWEHTPEEHEEAAAEGAKARDARERSLERQARICYETEGYHDRG